MKTIFLFLLVILISCQQQSDCTNGIQDGNETGIDCGGNCTSCSYTTSQNTPPSDLLKMWYKTVETGIITNQSGGTYGKGSTIYYNNNCPVKFTSTVSTINPNGFVCYGQINQCTYPGQNSYIYDQTVNTIAGYLYNFITPDSVVFSSYSGEALLYYSSSSPVSPTQESIDWEVNLANNYPNNGEITINIWVNNSLVSSIPIVSGQTSYSGTALVNLSYSNPNIYINVNSLVTSPSTNTISFSKKLLRNGVILGETGVGTYAVGTGNPGYDMLTGGAPCVIFWE